MNAWGIVLAAGRGARLGSGVPKAFHDLAGQPMLVWTLRAFEDAPSITGVCVVVPEEMVVHDLHMERLGLPTRMESRWPRGGQTRQESVRRALEALRAEDEPPAVVIHDAARPLVTPELIERALAGLGSADVAVCAIPVSDTLKRAEFESVAATVPRGDLWRAQTPQAFRTAVLREAHERADAEGFEGTDDAQLVERCGGLVVLVPGDERNIKVTTPADLAIAEALLSEPRGRSGIGYDAHAFADGRALVLGGVEIPHHRGLTGHSDADVLSHAIADALLGAAALGDLGEHFPSSDPKWEAVSSLVFLRDAARLVSDAGYEIASVDATLVIQEPVIAPYRDEMRKRIADALGVGVERVSVKASTTDRIGGIGRGEGAAAVAVARLDPR